MYECAGREPEHRHQAGPLPLAETARDHVQNPGTRDQQHDECRRDERKQRGAVRHQSQLVRLIGNSMTRIAPFSVRSIRARSFDSPSLAYATRCGKSCSGFSNTTSMSLTRNAVNTAVSWPEG